MVTRLYGYELLVFALVALAAAGPIFFLARVSVALVGGVIAQASEDEEVGVAGQKITEQTDYACCPENRR